jgi:hypothetical protein
MMAGSAREYSAVREGAPGEGGLARRPGGHDRCEMLAPALIWTGRDVSSGADGTHARERVPSPLSDQPAAPTEAHEDVGGPVPVDEDKG